jgi:hypothetical protein
VQVLSSFLSMTRVSDQRIAVDQFKRRTLNKLEGLRCGKHRQSPRVLFEGMTLQTVTIRMSGCCDALIARANQKIAEP